MVAAEKGATAAGVYAPKFFSPSNTRRFKLYARPSFQPIATGGAKEAVRRNLSICSPVRNPSTN